VTEIAKKGTGAVRLPALANEINAEHRAFIGSLTRTAEHGIRAGELLAEAKGQCKHGEWLPWLRQNFEGSERSAQVYMQMYRNRDEIRAKYAESADLSISGALQEISAPREAPDEAGDGSPEMSRETLKEIEGRLKESIAKTKESEQKLKEADEAIREAIDGLFKSGHTKEAHVELRRKTFHELGLAAGTYNMSVVSARSTLKEYLEVLAAGGSEGSGAVRERVEERFGRLEPLHPEERGLLKQFYPDELKRVDANTPRVLFFCDLLEMLDNLVCPADLPEWHKPNGLKNSNLTDEQMKTSIAELLKVEALEEKDVYRFEPWPHPLLWIDTPEEEEELEDWQPSEWWLKKMKEVLAAYKEGG